jgi:hypothetical protein
MQVIIHTWKVKRIKKVAIANHAVIWAEALVVWANYLVGSE